MADPGSDAPDLGRMLIPPSVRERAAELGIPLGSIAGMRGTGPRGRLRVADLEHIDPGAGAAASRTDARPVDVAPSVAAPGTASSSVTVALDPRALARAHRAMADAAAAADLTSAVEVDLGATVAALEARTGRGPGTDLFADHLLTHLARCVIRTLESYPMLNARIDMETDGGRTILRADVDLALIMSGDRGDVRRVVPAVGRLDEEALHQRIRAIGLLARAGVAGVEDPGPEAASGGTGTFALIDRRGRPVLFETPPLPSGCSGALAVGMLEKRPLVDARTGGLRTTWAAYLCLTYDHRLIDGADAARFLGELAERFGTSGEGPAHR